MKRAKFPRRGTNKGMIFVVLLAAALGGGGADAGPQGPSPGGTSAFTVPWFTVDGGGGVSATPDGSFAIAGTIGQPDAGPPLRGDGFLVQGGFWVVAPRALIFNSNFEDGTLKGWSNASGARSVHEPDP